MHKSKIPGMTSYPPIPAQFPPNSRGVKPPNDLIRFPKNEEWSTEAPTSRVDEKLSLLCKVICPMQLCCSVFGASDEEITR